MLQLLLHIIIISLTCIIWGIPGYIIARNKINETYWFRDKQNLPVGLFFIGLLTISFISSWLILLFPIQFYQLAIATGILAIILIATQRGPLLEFLQIYRGKKRSVSITIFSIAVIFLLILCGTLKTVNDDTQLYHLQIIRWLNEYGAVRGTANIYPRLGLGSNWFTIISAFHIPQFKIQNFTFLNSTVTIWFLFWLINRINYFYKLSTTSPIAKVFLCFNFLMLVYFLADWQLFRDTANSTSYDFIVTILIIFVISYLAESAFTEEFSKFSYLFMLLCFCIPTYKLSGMFILIPALFYMMRYRKPIIWVKLVGMYILINLPVLIKNYIITGYPLFPSTLSVGSPEWQLPVEMAGTFRDYILNANRFYNHQLHFIATFEKNEFNWIPFWIKGITITHKILILMAVSSLVLFYRNGLSYRISIRFKWLLVSIWMMAAAWFFTAPDPRFAFGFLIFLAFFPISMLGANFIPMKIYPYALLLLTAPVLLYLTRKIKPILSAPIHAVFPIPSDQTTYTTRTINGIPFQYPINMSRHWNNRCYYLPPPCLCEENPYLQPIGKEIKNGFKLSPKPDSNFIKTFNY